MNDLYYPFLYNTGLLVSLFPFFYQPSFLPPPISHCQACTLHPYVWPSGLTGSNLLPTRPGLTLPSPQPPATQDRRNRDRIRDNQRRSRARKREYIQELEQRLRLAEQRGVQASLELQAAARQVAEENKKLRLLLRLHGVSDRSIDAYLAGESRKGERGRAREPPAAPAPAPAPAPEPAAQRLERLLRPEACPVVLAAASTPSSDQGDKNNCAMAADLISTMTGVNPHEVRVSLGCAPGADCHVDDARIGSAIERFTESGAVT
ncbi:hypothetical protein VTG60DRAFT_6288 [Thermothelomyces hinnuleus]